MATTEFVSDMAYFLFFLDRFHRISVRVLNSVSPGPREHLSVDAMPIWVLLHEVSSGPQCERFPAAPSLRHSRCAGDEVIFPAAPGTEDDSQDFLRLERR